MKKIILSLTCLVVAISLFAQHPIGNDSFQLQTLGSFVTLVKSKGAAGSDSGFVNAAFADTSAANKGKIKNYPGAQIRVADTLWMRNKTATAWIKVGSGATGAGSTGIGAVYAGNCLTQVNDSTLELDLSCLESIDTIFSFHTDSVVVNKKLRIPLTDTTHAKKGCGSIIYDTILEHYFGDVCINGVHYAWQCFDCTSTTVSNYSKNGSNDSTILLLSDGTRYAASDRTGTGTVTSVATNTGTGITGGTITTTGTLAIDTSIISTKANVNSKTITINAGSNVTISQAATQNLGTPPSWTINATTSGGSTNSNIGSGYRLAVPNTNNIKTLHAGTNVTIDSVSNANEITINVPTADTTSLSKRINTIDVFAVAGQSNARGSGSNSASGSPTVPTGKVLQFWNETFTDANDPVSNANSASAWPAFGLNYYTITGHKVLFIPFTGTGGNSQTAAANPGTGTWDTTGTLFDTLVARINRGLTAITAQGYTPVLRGILWVQGETDAAAINSSTITQAAYKAAFKKMIGRFRGLYPKIPFYLSRTGTDTTVSDVGFAAVRAVQQQVADADSLTNIVYWDANDFARRHWMADNLHYTNTGYNDMGRKMAENITASSGMKFQSSNDTGSTNKSLFYMAGNVGINKYNPGYKLEVTGTGFFSDTLTATTLGNTDSSNRVASTAWVKRQSFGSGGGGGYWPLSGTGSITQNDTISWTTANQVNFRGLITTTANNQWQRQEAYKTTMRATASDISSGIIVFDTASFGANSQEHYALDLRGNIITNGFSSTNYASIRAGGNIIPSVTNTIWLGTSSLLFQNVYATNWNGTIWNTTGTDFTLKNATNVPLYISSSYTTRLGRFASTGTDSLYSLQVHGEIQSYGGNIMKFADPTISAILQGGTPGSTTYKYKIVYRDINGNTTASSAEATTTVGPATLNGTNYNRVQWTAPDGVYYVDVYRTSSSGTPSTTGKIATVSGYAGLQVYNDQGAAGDGTTGPTENTTGSWGIGIQRPLAALDIKAGLASAGGAVMQLHSGVAAQTTQIAGQVNYDGDLHLSDGSSNYTIDKSLTGSATLDFASTGAGAVADLTITVTGAASGDVVVLGVPNGSVTATATFTAWVSSANTVTVRFSPKATEDPASGTFKVRVIK